MKRLLTRIAGIALILAAIGGLILTVAGLVILAQTKDRMLTASMSSLDLLDRTLVATGDGLTVAGQSLTSAQDGVVSLETTLKTTGTTIDDAIPAVNAVGAMLGEQLPATLAATQESLRSAQSSAQVIDGFLITLSSIPLINVGKYNPEQSLSSSLGAVAGSLDDLPASLAAAKDGLDKTVANLETFQGNFTQVAAPVGQIAASLKNAEGVITQYQGVIKDLQGAIASVRPSLPAWLRWLQIAGSLVLIWLGIAQIGLLTQGFELIGRSRRTATN